MLHFVHGTFFYLVIVNEVRFNRDLYNPEEMKAFKKGRINTR